MAYEAEQNPLCYEGTSVLRNRADLRSQGDLDEFEFLMFLSRASEPLPDGGLDFDHYRSIHHHLFQDVYDWAGEPRAIRIAKGGNWFCYPENISAEASRIFGWLAERDWLQNADRTHFGAGAAYFLSELNAMHAFREGNGRTQLVWLKMLATRAGYTFDDDALDPTRTLDAMIASFAGNLTPLELLIADVIA